jgi:hypothetical protein
MVKHTLSPNDDSVGPANGSPRFKAVEWLSPKRIGVDLVEIYDLETKAHKKPRLAVSDDPKHRAP